MGRTQDVRWTVRVGVVAVTALLGGLLAVVAAPPAAAVTVWNPGGACGSLQTTTVPNSVFSMTVALGGGAGGDAGSQASGSSGDGARGGQVSATFAVLPGQTVSAREGCAGANGANSLNQFLPGGLGWSPGGGAGHGQSTIFADGAQGGAGGGSSAVCIGSVCDGANRNKALVVAGGGGGGGVSSCAGTPGGNGGSGGVGGSTAAGGGSGPSGENGGGGGNSGSGSGGGSGGAGGINSVFVHGPPGQNGTNGSGGAGVNVAGGGGGAGWEGGSRGGNSATGCKGAGGAGGGTSWADDDGSAVSFSTNGSDHGSVTVTFADPEPCPTTIAAGDEADYRFALACLSDAGGPTHTLDITDDIDLDDGSDPVYDGAEPLVINGNGHTIAAGGTSRILKHGSFALATLNEVVLDGGDSEAAGGAVRASGPVTVENSTLTGSVAAQTGGSVHADGVLTVRNTTATDNTASTGGGAFYGGSVVLEHVTVVDNSSASGANVRSAGGLTSTATVFAGAGDDCSIAGPTTSTDSWSDDVSCDLTGTGDMQDVGGDPVLGPPRDNGSPPTMFPLAGSPLVDAIPGGRCAGAPLDTDERGVARPFGGRCDIGAIEAVFAAHGFTDVSPFYEAAVRWTTSPVNTPQLQLGFPDNTFRRNIDINRGQAAYLLYNEAGAPDVSGLDHHGFTDVSPFFDDAVTWSKANDVFLGYDDDTFREKKPISRGQLVRAKWGFAGQQGGHPDSGFPDVISFFKPAVNWAKAHGLVNGFPNGKFKTNANILRGDATRIDYNLAQSPDAWMTPGSAWPNMLFRSNLN